MTSKKEKKQINHTVAPAVVSLSTGQAGGSPEPDPIVTRSELG